MSRDPWILLEEFTFENKRMLLADSRPRQAVVHLQLHTGVAVRFLPTWKDFCHHITMTTRAVAEAPFK